MTVVLPDPSDLTSTVALEHAAQLPYRELASAQAGDFVAAPLRIIADQVAANGTVTGRLLDNSLQPTSTTVEIESATRQTHAIVGQGSQYDASRVLQLVTLTPLVLIDRTP